MERLCSRIILLLLIGTLISSTSQEELNVHLEPKYIQVCEGDSVTINCFFQPGGKHKVSWHYSQTPNLGCDSNKIPEGRFYTEHNDTWAAVNINSIKTNDSGWYFCKVTRDTIVLEKKCSNGTQVLVVANRTQEYLTQPQMQNPTQNLTTKDSPTTSLLSATTIQTTSSTPLSTFEQWWIWLAVALGWVVLVVSIVCLCIFTRTPKDIIYKNTKPVEPACVQKN